jgi:hypothetical protein
MGIRWYIQAGRHPGKCRKMNQARVNSLNRREPILDSQSEGNFPRGSERRSKDGKNG